jgi:hypothetical protein
VLNLKALVEVDETLVADNGDIFEELKLEALVDLDELVVVDD